MLLNVWATWCPPCQLEMPDFQRIHDAFGPRGLNVIAVSVDRPDAGDALRRFRDERGMTFRILHDPTKAVMQRFGTHGIPESYLIGRDGRLLARWVGRIHADSPALRRRLLSALAERGGGR